MADLRVLLPQRLDIQSRMMDTNVLGHWLGLAEACDVVLHGPGLEGYDDRPLGTVARDADCDLILLPDLHHAIPGIWDDLWSGTQTTGVPVCWYLTDFGSELAARRTVFERVRPELVLISGDPSAYRAYDDLFAAIGARLVVVPLGYDPALFHLPPAGSGRDIDILVAGADRPSDVYPTRGPMKAAARLLAGSFNVVELDHPGYWECDPGRPQARGQCELAGLMRRARLVICGSAFGCYVRKYYETAASGAVPVGDLPEHPDVDRFRGVSVEIAAGATPEAIAETIAAVLRDRPACAALGAAAASRLEGADHAARGEQTAAALAAALDLQPRRRRPRTTPPPPPALLVIASADPGAVPAPRTDWVDIWRDETSMSRTRLVERALAAGDADIAVLALDPDAALPADALWLAETARRAGGCVVIRPMRPGSGDLVGDGIALVAAPRRALLAAVAGERGRVGLERALLTLCATSVPVVLAEPGAAGAAADLALVEAAIGPVAAQAATGVDGPVGPPQDPELTVSPVAGAVLVELDPTTLGDLARQAATGVATEIAVPVALGLSPDEAADVVVAALDRAGVDLDAADLVLLERPLHAAEIAWLRRRGRRQERAA